MIDNQIKKNNFKTEVPFFLTYTFLIPLVCVMLMKILGKYDSNGIMTLVLYGIEGASPAIATVIVMLQKHGVNGLKKFLKSKYISNFSIRMCLLGLCVPAFVLLVSKLITYLTPYNNNFAYSLRPKKILIIMWALVAEELGWRGYLQDKVEKRFGAVATPLIIGAIWAAWHYHFFISGSMEVPIVLFVLGCITESCSYYILTKISKGNIVPASLWHFSGNLFFNIFRINPQWNNGSTVPYMIVSIFYLIYFITFAIFIRRTKTKCS